MELAIETESWIDENDDSVFYIVATCATGRIELKCSTNEILFNKHMEAKDVLSKKTHKYKISSWICAISPRRTLCWTPIAA